MKKIVRGEPYFIKGQGPCLIVDMWVQPARAAFNAGEQCVGYAGHGRSYEDTMKGGFSGNWGPAEEIVGSPATPELLRKFHEEGRVRGVECKEPDCWCVKMREES